jgi:hypothetical protein
MFGQRMNEFLDDKMKCQHSQCSSCATAVWAMQVTEFSKVLVTVGWLVQN